MLSQISQVRHSEEMVSFAIISSPINIKNSQIRITVLLSICIKEVLHSTIEVLHILVFVMCRNRLELQGVISPASLSIHDGLRLCVLK